MSARPCGLAGDCHSPVATGGEGFGTDCQRGGVCFGGWSTRRYTRSSVWSSPAMIRTGEAIANVGVARTNAEHLPSHWLNSYFPVRVGNEMFGVGVIGVDVTERKRDAELHSVVMPNMAEGLYALDAKGRVTYLNPAASKMLGWAPDELIGKPMHETVLLLEVDGLV